MAKLGKEIIEDLGVKSFEPEGIARYFDILYAISADNYGMLDEKKVLDEFEFNASKFNFKTVSEKFKIIDDNTYDIILQINDEVKTNVQKLRDNTFNRTTVRQLSQYSVSVYSGEYDKLKKDNVIDNINGFYVLNNPNYYNDESGLNIFSETNLNAECDFI
jgi:hypothetical protein